MVSSRTRQLFESNDLRRKKYKEYLCMSKKGLVRVIICQFANYDMLRKRYGDLCLENDYLKRRINTLLEKIKILGLTGDRGVRNFTHLNLLRKNRGLKVFKSRGKYYGKNIKR